MRKFLINVNGNSYEVEVEEVKDGVAAAPVKASAVPTTPAPKAAQAVTPTAPAPAKKAAAPVEVPAGANAVNAPMPGTILRVDVAAGDSVKKGQVLCILEAMKMENEIMSPADATVASVAINQGDSVNTGQVLIVLG